MTAAPAAWRPRCGTRWRRARAAATCPTTFPGRDEATERDVDPMRLLVVGGPDVPGGLVPAAPRRCGCFPAGPGARPWPCWDEAAFGAGPGPAQGRGPGPVPAVGRKTRRWSLSWSAAGRWVAEYYPCEHVEELGDGRLRVGLRTPDTRWVRRLRACGSARTAG